MDCIKEGCETVGFRLPKSVYERVIEVVNANPEKYTNISHFFRCGAIMLLDYELEKSNGRVVKKDEDRDNRSS